MLSIALGDIYLHKIRLYPPLSGHVVAVVAIIIGISTDGNGRPSLSRTYVRARTRTRITKPHRRGHSRVPRLKARMPAHILLLSVIIGLFPFIPIIINQSHNNPHRFLTSAMIRGG